MKSAPTRKFMLSRRSAGGQLFSKGPIAMSPQTPFQPNVSDLMARFLQKKAQAHRDGFADAALVSEVTPYEAGPVQPVDAKVAWEEAVAVAPFFHANLDIKKWPVPPHWTDMVAGHEPALAISFSLGNFPQLLRNFHLILQKTNLADFKPSAGRPLSIPALIDWAQHAAAQKHYPNMLVALGVLRLSKNFDQALAFQKTNDALIPPAWRAAWDNEKASLDWHQGKTEEASRLWNAMESNVPVLFNRGMADVFRCQTDQGRNALNQVIAQLPETSAWHHLARVYVLLDGTN